VQSAGLPGEVSISVANIDARLNLPACLAPQAFLPPNSRIWGKTAVGVRCNAPAPWTMYVMATVRVIGDYVTPAAPMVYGQVIGPNDITRMKGDLTALPYGIITDPAQAIGRTAALSLQAGMPIRQDAVRSPRAVQQGQVVKVISQGHGFSVASEGRALSNGSEGQTVQARTPAGQVVSGLARAGGVVEVVF
jgi:flagella basal body P-ring formation protein FlgA